MSSKLYDVIIVGGGPAGLSAAIWLGRYLHSVAVVDSGDPRNWETRGINGYLGLPGVRPAELRRAGREEARRYDVQLIDGFAVSAGKESDERFVIDYDPIETTKAAEGRRGPGTPRTPEDNAPRPTTRRLVGRRLFLAVGLKDVWPSPRIEGFEEVYGDRAHVCPDCDGYEARGKKTVVIGKGRKAVGLTLALSNWTDNITVCTHGQDCELDDELGGKLAALGIPVIAAEIARINFRDGTMRSLYFVDGTTLGCEKIFFSIGQYPADDLGAQLGCERDDDGYIVTDRVGHTSVYNVFAGGDYNGGSQLAITAAGDGAVSALAIHRSLLPDERKLEKRDKTPAPDEPAAEASRG
jgi:thioredoxin reductase